MDTSVDAARLEQLSVRVQFLVRLHLADLGDTSCGMPTSATADWLPSTGYEVESSL